MTECPQCPIWPSNVRRLCDSPRVARIVAWLVEHHAELEIINNGGLEVNWKGEGIAYAVTSRLHDSG